MDSIKRSLVILLFSLLFSSVSFCFPIALLAADQGDKYEPDDSYAAASDITPIPGDTVEHNDHTFHKFFDEDWIRFNADKGRTYFIEAVPRDSNILCDPIIELYASDGTTLLKRVNNSGVGGQERLDWISPENASFFIKFVNDSIYYSSSVIYDVSISATEIFPPPGYLSGRVTNLQGVGIVGVIFETATGAGRSISEGNYIIGLESEVEVDISIHKDGYQSQLLSVTIPEGKNINQDIVLTPNSNNKPPTITGSPEKVIIVNGLYSFRPIANDDDNDSLSFSITNKPSWLNFNPENGMVIGVPNVSHIGNHGPITITVQDSQGGNSNLSPFMIEVKDVVFSPGILILLMQ